MKILALTLTSILLCLNSSAQCNFGNDDPLGAASGHVRDYLLGTAIQLNYSANISHLGMICMDDNDNFKVAVYDDNNGAPGNLLTSGSGTTEIGEVIVDVPDIVVEPGTYYFMAVFESSTSISCGTVADQTMWYIPHSYDASLPSQLENLSSYTERKFSYFLICEPNVSLSCVNTTIYADETNADSYQWMDCNTGNIIPGANSSSFTGNLYESYYCIVTQNGCSRISECFTIGVTGTEEQKLSDRIVLAPNPSNGNFSIQFKDLYEEFEIVLYDLNGQVVEQFHTSSTSKLDIKSEVIPGTYLLQVTSDNDSFTERIVIN